MSCNHNRHHRPGCIPPQPYNIIAQAVRDALADRIVELQGYSTSAAQSALAAAASATEAKDAAALSEQYRDQSQVILNSAQQLVPVINDTATKLQETAQIVKDIAETASSFQIIKYPYTVVGSESTITIPSNYSVLTVQSMIVEGLTLTSAAGDFVYDTNTRVITLAQEFPEEAAGLVVVISLGQLNVESPETALSSLASDSGAGLVGTASGNSVQSELNTVYGELDNQQDTLDRLGDSVDQILPELAKPTGAGLIKTSRDNTVEAELTSIFKYAEHRITNNYALVYQQKMVTDVNPQGLAEDNSYWYMTEDVTGAGTPYSCTLSRISKATGVKNTFSATFGSHGQGIGVLKNGEIIIGGSANGKLYQVNFNSGTYSEVSCIGLMKDFPFCYDAERDLIYQLQDANGTSANITRIAILGRTVGFIADNSIDRKLVKPMYPQGITTDGAYLYVICGGSWSAASSGDWNDTITCYKTSLSGEILDRVIFKRTAFGDLVNKATVTQQEPQAVSWFKNKLSFLHYIGDSTGSVAAIITEDVSGTAIRSVPKNAWTFYYSLSELGINSATLATGSSILSIANAMPDNSSVTFSVSNETALATDLGISFGVVTITKINANRIVAHAIESSSSISTSQGPTETSVSVFGSVQSPYLRLRSRKAIAVGYESTAVVTSGISITVAGLASANEVILHITHGTGSNPVTPFKFTKDELDYYVSNNIPLYLSDGTGALTCTFTATGLSIAGVSASPVIRRVLVM